MSLGIRRCVSFLIACVGGVAIDNNGAFDVMLFATVPRGGQVVKINP